MKKKIFKLVTIGLATSIIMGQIPSTTLAETIDEINSSAEKQVVENALESSTVTLPEGKSDTLRNNVLTAEHAEVDVVTGPTNTPRILNLQPSSKEEQTASNTDYIINKNKGSEDYGIFPDMYFNNHPELVGGYYSFNQDTNTRNLQLKGTSNYTGKNIFSYGGEEDWVNWRVPMMGKMYAQEALDDQGTKIYNKWNVTTKWLGSDYEATDDVIIEKEQKLDVLIVFDRSYSMLNNTVGENGKSIDRTIPAVQGLHRFLDNLNQDDKVTNNQIQLGYIDFSTGVKQTYGLGTSIQDLKQYWGGSESSNKNNFNSKGVISEITPERDSGTATEVALRTASDILEQTSRKDAKKAIILITDGVPQNRIGVNTAGAVSAMEEAYKIKNQYNSDDLQNNDLSIYSVGIQINEDEKFPNYNSKENLPASLTYKSFLEYIASKNEYYKNVEDTSELVGTLSTIQELISETTRKNYIERGTLVQNFNRNITVHPSSFLATITKIDGQVVPIDSSNILY